MINKKFHLSIGEREIVEKLREGAGITEIEAIEEVLSYKREQALLYEQQGNLELTRHLLSEIGEWSSDREQYYLEWKQLKNKQSDEPEEVQIVLL